MSKESSNSQKRRRDRDSSPSSRKKNEKAPFAQIAPSPDAEETRLANLLFGVSDPVASKTEIHTDKPVVPVPQAKKAPVWVDDDEVDVDLLAVSRTKKLRVDENDITVNLGDYETRLRGQLAKAAADVGEDLTWATSTKKQRADERAEKKRAKKAVLDEDDLSSSDEEEIGSDTEDLLTSALPIMGTSSALEPGTLGITRLRDANIRDPARSTIRACGFHPKGAEAGSVYMTGSTDCKLRFYRIDGKENSKLLSVHLPDLPVASAAWLGDGSEVIATGRRPYFYTYDMNAGKLNKIPRIIGRSETSLESAVVSPGHPSSSSSMIAFLGKDGTTILTSAATKQWIGNLRQPGTVRAAAFSRGSTSGAGGAGPLDYPELLTIGSYGEVYKWDLRTLKCLSKHKDEGNTGGTAIAVRPDGKGYAVGSQMGVVNIYNEECDAPQAPKGIFSVVQQPKPTKTLMHITTAIDHLNYSPDGAILLASSQRLKDSLKMIHVSSGTVFANWPTQRTPLSYVTACAFSPGGAYLTIGNDKGRALLYRLHHYNRA